MTGRRALGGQPLTGAVGSPEHTRSDLQADLLPHCLDEIPAPGLTARAQVPGASLSRSLHPRLSGSGGSHRPCDSSDGLSRAAGLFEPGPCLPAGFGGGRASTLGAGPRLTLPHTVDSLTGRPGPVRSGARAARVQRPNYLGRNSQRPCWQPRRPPTPPFATFLSQLFLDSFGELGFKSFGYPNSET